MRIISTKTWPLASVAVAALMAVAGCTDSKYDFNEIDSTIGIGGDRLTLPGSSTDIIQLSDVLDIDDSECVETRENGDYVFTQTGDDVEPAHPTIDVVRLTDGGSYTEPVPFLASSAAGDVQIFTYTDTWPEGVVELASAVTTEQFTMEVIFSDALKNSVSTLKELSLTFPAYMSVSGVAATPMPVMQGSKMTFTNVSTATPLRVTGNIDHMDFTVADDGLGSLIHDTSNDMMVLNGKVHVQASFTEEAGKTYDYSGRMFMTSSLDISQFEIRNVTGRFDPDIDLDDLGDVTITGVPDFLTDGEVTMDIYNPQIVLTITNDMDIEGLMSGDLMPYKDGMALLTQPVTIPDTRIHANGTTEVYICRDVAALGNVGTPGAMVEKTQVSDLSKLIETIPDRITFDANVRANSDKEGSFELGNTYTVNTSYNIEAPLAFAENAKIVYNDTINEWQEDIEDIEFKEGSYLELKGEILNCIPLYLNISATPIDVDGNLCQGAHVEVVKGEAVASGDGVNAESSELEIRISGDISELDGLVLRIEASASERDADGNIIPGSTVKGITLNEKEHYIIVRDIEISLNGTIVIDMN